MADFFIVNCMRCDKEFSVQAGEENQCPVCGCFYNWSEATYPNVEIEQDLWDEDEYACHVPGEKEW